MISQSKKFSNRDCIRNTSFHRHPIYNPKIYYCNSPESDNHLFTDSPIFRQKFTSNYHSLNDTFTINSVKHKNSTLKVLPPLDIQQNQTRKKKDNPRQCLNRNNSFHPFQPVLYTTSSCPMMKTPTHPSNGKISNSTQTPRIGVPHRQKQSVQKYVERNLKFHKNENAEKLKFHQSNSLTYLQRVYLPRINLYNKNNTVQETPPDNQQRIYDYQNEHNLPLHHNYDQTCHNHNCCLHNNANHLTDMSDSTDSVTDCIHFSNPNNRFPQNKNHNSPNHHQHQEKLQHIQILNSPIMWGNRHQKEKQPQTDSDSSEIDWLMEIDDEPTNQNPPKPVFKERPFDFWRDDDNFEIDESTSIIARDKHVRFD